MLSSSGNENRLRSKTYSPVSGRPVASADAGRCGARSCGGPVGAKPRDEARDGSVDTQQPGSRRDRRIILAGIKDGRKRRCVMSIGPRTNRKCALGFLINEVHAGHHHAVSRGRGGCHPALPSKVNKGSGSQPRWRRAMVMLPAGDGIVGVISWRSGAPGIKDDAALVGATGWVVRPSSWCKSERSLRWPSIRAARGGESCRARRRAAAV